MSSNDSPKPAEEAPTQTPSKGAPGPLFHAFFIGLLIGIIVYGVAANGFGLFMLIPLGLIYVFVNNGKKAG